MIAVVATIRVREGRLAEFLEIFKANVPAVLAEDGCIEYIPAVDADAGVDSQIKEPSSVTVLEKWADLAALEAHFQAPHMIRYREKAKDLIEGVRLRILQEA